jgi:hypothetical protein
VRAPRGRRAPGQAFCLLFKAIVSVFRIGFQWKSLPIERFKPLRVLRRLFFSTGLSHEQQVKPDFT